MKDRTPRDLTAPQSGVVRDRRTELLTMDDKYNEYDRQMEILFKAETEAMTRKLRGKTEALCRTNLQEI